MAKTNFGALMQITSVWLNKVFAHRHDGLDQDGSGPINYAADSGAADAYAIALSPALTAHVEGMPIYFKPAHTNTGASTIAINGLAAAAIKKNGSTAILAGELVANQVVCIVWDGTNYQLITSPRLSSDSTNFKSAEQNYGTGIITVAHGLGAKPRTVRVVAICKIAELNYSVGDEIDFTNNGYYNWTYAYTVADNANITWVCSGSSLTIMDKSSRAFSSQNATAANWRMVFYASL